MHTEFHGEKIWRDVRAGTTRARPARHGIKQPSSVKLGVHSVQLGVESDCFATSRSDHSVSFLQPPALGDVIVFRAPAAARSDLKLWAHELTHVLQYRRWGLQGFAARYVTDHVDVEREAYANADRFVACYNKNAH